MKKFIGISVVALLLCCTYVETFSASTSSKRDPTWTSNWTPSWAEEEKVIADALLVRAKDIEKKTGISFGKNWRPKVSLEWAMQSNGNSIYGLYTAENKTIHFVADIIRELTLRTGKALSQQDPAVVAKDEFFAVYADHELGHALSDIVSRRAHKKPFFTEAQYFSLDRERKWGLNVIAEGIGTYFASLHAPLSETSERHFPESLEQQRFFAFEDVMNFGGYWMVKDVLDQYGERGMKWLVTHRFIASGNMRAAAIEYRARVLSELARGK